ncbi:MAG: cytidylate kinase-like family protein [Anaerolineales bacterium]|jgi:cytidylate kinase|nr:cytidylate kinase-like family protein [Anaerolineales bacterium]
MATITISRQFGSHGDTVAQMLAAELGYRYFDKNLMIGLAVSLGMKPEKVVDASEEHPRARSLIERLFVNFAPPMGEPTVWAAAAEAQAQERLQVEHVNNLILAAHQQGKVVIIGRGGQCLLHGLPDVVCVRLQAPLELRIQRHQERAGLAPEAARAQVLLRDQASADYVQQYFQADINEPTLYDLILNTGKLAPARAVELIVRAVDMLPGR